MITVGMNYHTLPGKQHDFEEKFAAVIGALNAAPGHTSSTLWKDVADDASYLITSECSDEDAFKSFITSEAFRSVTTWGKERNLERDALDGDVPDEECDHNHRSAAQASFALGAAAVMSCRPTQSFTKTYCTAFSAAERSFNIFRATA